MRIFLLAPPSPNGLIQAFRVNLNSGEKTLFIAFYIDSLLARAFITLVDCDLPRCLRPMFTVPTFRVGASDIPLEELPTTPSTVAKQDK